MKIDDFCHDFSGYQPLRLYQPISVITEGVPLISDFSFEEETILHTNHIFTFKFEIFINNVSHTGTFYISGTYEPSFKKDAYILQFEKEDFNSFYECFVFAYVTPILLQYIEEKIQTWKLRSLFSLADKKKWVFATHIQKEQFIFCKHYHCDRHIPVDKLNDYCEAIIENDKRYEQYMLPIFHFYHYFIETEQLNTYHMWKLFSSFLNHILHTCPEKMVSFDEEEVDVFLALKTTKKEGIDEAYLIIPDQEIDIRNIIMKWKQLLSSQISEETYQNMISK